MKRDHIISVGILISAVIFVGWRIYYIDDYRSVEVSFEKAEEPELLSGGVVLPAVWSDLGAKLVSVGVIDAEKFQEIYQSRGSFTDEYENLLGGKNNGPIKINEDNAGFWLNLLWALGLANQNPILDYGEMADPRYGGAENFASTAGWTLAVGNPMDHYSRHQFFSLTAEQQALVDKISRGIYRPCCGNSTHFPDCNHGMAMLGLLELMASQGTSEKDMWSAALTVNSYWFPDNYANISKYFENQDLKLEAIDAKEILGPAYSSASGYRQMLMSLEPIQPRSSSSCGI